MTGTETINGAGGGEARMCEAGRITGHYSDPDGSPDVGYSVGLGDGKMLWVGEITKARFTEAGADAAALGGHGGWWFILYGQNKDDTQVLGKAMPGIDADALCAAIAAALAAPAAKGGTDHPVKVATLRRLEALRCQQVCQAAREQGGGKSPCLDCENPDHRPYATASEDLSRIASPPGAAGSEQHRDDIACHCAGSHGPNPECGACGGSGCVSGVVGQEPAGDDGGGESDLAALSAGATPGEWCGHLLFEMTEGDSNFCDALVNLYRSGRLIEAPAPEIRTQGEPVAWKVAQIIAHNLCGYVDEADAENFLNGASKTAQEILTLVSSASQTARPAWVKAYEAECQRDGADFDAEACIAENFPQIVAEQQPAAQSKAVARDAVLAVVRAAWALVDNTGVHDLLPLAVNRDDWNDLAARFAALKSLLPADELPADPPHAVAYFWPTNAALSEAPAAPRSASPVTVEEIARTILDHRGFGFYTDPMEGGQNAYDISCEALNEAEAIHALLQAPRPGGETGDGWMPIETAPTDAKEYPVQICGGSVEGTSVAFWRGEIGNATWWHRMAAPPANSAPAQAHDAARSEGGE